jgi:PPP family 3-phenylpropionic acid transporter
MFNAQAIQRRFGLRAMIAAGIIGTALRWELVSWATGAAALVAIQTLHGVTFGLYHTAAVQYVDALSSPATKNTAQSLHSASTFGLGSTVGALLAGWLFPIWGFVSLLHAGAVLAALAGFLFVLFSYRLGKKGVKKEGGRPTGRKGLAP